MRKTPFLLIVLSTAILAGCGSGVTVETDSPVDLPESVEAGGVTIQTPDEVNVGDVQVETEDGRITAK